MWHNQVSQMGCQGPNQTRLRRHKSQDHESYHALLRFIEDVTKIMVRDEGDDQ